MSSEILSAFTTARAAPASAVAAELSQGSLDSGLDLDLLFPVLEIADSESELVIARPKANADDSALLQTEPATDSGTSANLINITALTTLVTATTTNTTAATAATASTLGPSPADLLPLSHPTNARYLSAVRIAIMAADAYSHVLFRFNEMNPPSAPIQTQHEPIPPAPQILPLCPSTGGGSYCLPTMFNGIVWCMRCRGHVRDPVS